MSVTTTSQVDWATADLAAHRWSVTPLPEHGSQEWLDMRVPYSNASTAAVHVREHEWETIAEWAARKISGEEVKQTPKMGMGLMLEPALVTGYAKETGIDWFPPGRAYGVGRLLANPDGIAYNAHDQQIGLEIKSTDGATSRKSRYWQCVAGMAASDFAEYHLVELWYEYGKLVPTVFTWTPEVEADARRLLAAVDRDWDWVDLGCVPEDAEITDDVAKMLTRKEATAKVEVPAVAADLIVERHHIDAVIAAGNERRDAITAELRMMFGDASLAVLPDGRKLGTYKTQKRAPGFDRAAFDLAYPGVYAEFVIPKSGRSLLFDPRWKKLAEATPIALAPTPDQVFGPLDDDEEAF